MTLKEYVFGRRIVLQSPWPKDKVAKRIKGAVGSPFALFHKGVLGGFYFGGLRLAWNTPMFRNGFRPVFTGRLLDQDRKTELHATFGAPWWVLAFFGIWYLLVVVMVVTLLNGPDWGDEPRSSPLKDFGGVIFAFALPPALHLLLNFRADAHYRAILDLLKREARLVPVGEDNRLNR